MGKKNKSQAQRYAEMMAEAQLEGKRRLAEAKRNDGVVFWTTSANIASDYDYIVSDYDYYKDAVVTVSTGGTYTLTPRVAAERGPTPSEPSLPADNIFNRVLDVDWEE